LTKNNNAVSNISKWILFTSFLTEKIKSNKKKEVDKVKKTDTNPMVFKSCEVVFKDEKNIKINNKIKITVVFWTFVLLILVYFNFHAPLF